MEIPDGGVSKNRAFTIFFPRTLFASAGIGGNTRLLFIHLQLLPAAPVTPIRADCMCTAVAPQPVPVREGVLDICSHVCRAGNASLAPGRDRVSISTYRGY